MDSENYARKIISSLKEVHITAKYEHYDFTKNGNQYATFTIQCPKRIADTLEDAVNSHINIQNGVCAKLIFIGRKEINKTLIEYVAQIMPHNYISKGNLAKETDKFLAMLPKEVDDYINTKKGKKRK